VDLGFEHETLGVYEQVTLTALDLLGSVLTAIFSAYCGTLDRLGIHHPGTWLGISLQANPKAFSYGPIDTLPGAVDTPLPKVVVDGGPSRELVRQQTPLAPTLQDVEDGV
jgi:hypothetical protein